MSLSVSFPRFIPRMPYRLPHLRESKIRPFIHMATLEAHPTIDLPLEVLELIVDEIATQGDKLTLRSFALVSRSFVARCQKHLFRTIDLGDKNVSGEEYYHLFFEILEQRPKFCSYVEDLRLVDTYVWDQNKDSTWLVQEDSICDLLDLLPNLHSFALSFNTSRPTWLSFNACIRHSLMQLAKRPTIQSFSLSHIVDFPPPCLVTLTTIRRLRLHDVHVTQAYLEDFFGVILELVSPSVSGLDTLILKAPTSATIHVLQNIFQLYPEPTLKALRISLLDEKNAELITESWNLIQWAAPSLTHLEWRPATRKNAVALRKYLFSPMTPSVKATTSLQVHRPP